MSAGVVAVMPSCASASARVGLLAVDQLERRRLLLNVDVRGGEDAPRRGARGDAEAGAAAVRRRALGPARERSHAGALPVELQAERHGERAGVAELAEAHPAEEREVLGRAEADVRRRRERALREAGKIEAVRGERRVGGRAAAERRRVRGVGGEAALIAERGGREAGRAVAKVDAQLIALANHGQLRRGRDAAADAELAPRDKPLPNGVVIQQRGNRAVVQHVKTRSQPRRRGERQRVAGAEDPLPLHRQQERLVRGVRGGAGVDAPAVVEVVEAAHGRAGDGQRRLVDEAVEDRDLPPRREHAIRERRQRDGLLLADRLAVARGLEVRLGAALAVDVGGVDVGADLPADGDIARLDAPLRRRRRLRGGGAASDHDDVERALAGNADDDELRAAGALAVEQDLAVRDGRVGHGGVDGGPCLRAHGARHPALPAGRNRRLRAPRAPGPAGRVPRGCAAVPLGRSSLAKRVPLESRPGHVVGCHRGAGGSGARSMGSRSRAALLVRRCRK